MLLQKLNDKNLILASRSPRRKQLMHELGFKFSVIVPNVDENYPEDLPIHTIAVYLSKIKAAAIKANKMDRSTIVIAADTIVTYKDEIIRKPENLTEAKQFLAGLSNKKHEVITGITLRTINRIHSFSATTDVVFSNLSKDEIDYYVENYSPLDKAGAYGIQEWIGHVAISKIEGSYTNVMGLPTNRLYHELSLFIDNISGNYHKTTIDL